MFESVSTSYGAQCRQDYGQEKSTLSHGSIPDEQTD